MLVSSLHDHLFRYLHDDLRILKHFRRYLNNDWTRFVSWFISASGFFGNGSTRLRLLTGFIGNISAEWLFLSKLTSSFLFIGRSFVETDDGFVQLVSGDQLLFIVINFTLVVAVVVVAIVMNVVADISVAVVGSVAAVSKIIAAVFRVLSTAVKFHISRIGFFTAVI